MGKDKLVMALGKRGVESMHLKARQAPEERNRLKIQHVCTFFGKMHSLHILVYTHTGAQNKTKPNICTVSLSPKTTQDKSHPPLPTLQWALVRSHGSTGGLGNLKNIAN